MPLIGGTGPDDPRIPKYGELEGVSAFGSVRYGEEGTCLTAMEVTQAAHDIIKADPDVMRAPEDLDGTLGAGAVTATQTFLEDNNIPGNWVNTTHTFRYVLRVIYGCFRYTQRFAQVSGKEEIFIVGTDLSTQIRDISATKRGYMQDACDSLGYDYSEVTGDWTLRQYLKHLAEQWGDNPVGLSIITI